MPTARSAATRLLSPRSTTRRPIFAYWRTSRPWRRRPRARASKRCFSFKGPRMVTIVLVALIVALLVGLPQSGWHQWGYGPSGLVGVVLIILLILLLLGRV